MELWNSLSGIVEVKMTSADSAAALREMNHRGIPVYNVVFVDDLTLTFQIQRKDHKRVKKLTMSRGDRLEINNLNGIYWVIKGLTARPVLVLGIVLLLSLSLWIPTRIFFVRIEGNRQIPARKIIEEAQLCGICFGAQRRDVRSEKMKNALLEAVPELQWAGINTSGCTAVISVREREIAEKKEQTDVVSSVVASSDGVISEMTVMRGNPLCRVGQAVKAGQVLVSGYTDCGLTIRAEQAQAEIFAETMRNLSVITPAEYIKKGDSSAVREKTSVIIGKKYINFGNSSGILDTTCDKMYTESYLLLPGDFQLPIALVTERWFLRNEAPGAAEKTAAEAVVLEFANSYLKQQMVAGQIRNRFESVSEQKGVFLLRGTYTCTEMICKTRIEEKLPDYAEVD